jgi:hypothetical protein
MVRIEAAAAAKRESVGFWLWGMRDDHPALTEWVIANVREPALAAIVRPVKPG